MKKIGVYVLLLTLTLFISFSFVTNVYARDNIMLNVTKEEVKLGDEITVSININSEHTDLYAYTAKLSYDKAVFEEITTENFAEEENWSDISYNEDNNKFALINKKAVNSEKLLKVKLKVRDDAKSGETTITVDNITASDGKKDITIEGSSAKVLVLKDSLAQGESISNGKTELSRRKHFKN